MPIMKSKTSSGSRVATGGHELVCSIAPWATGAVNIVGVDPIIQPVTNQTSVNGFDYACVGVSGDANLFGWIGPNDIAAGNFPVGYGPEGGIGWRGGGDSPGSTLFPEDVCIPLPPSGTPGAPSIEMYARLAEGSAYEFLLTVYYIPGDGVNQLSKLHRKTWYRTTKADPQYVLFEHPWEDVPIKLRGVETFFRYGPSIADMACCNNHVPDIFAWSLGNRRRLRRFFGRNIYIPFPASGGADPPHVDCHVGFLEPGPFGMYYTMHYTRDDEG